jgi:Uma2 family endonuclease
MNIALRVPQMSREEFLDWAEAQNERFEFDGFQPVAMVGGTRTHSQICQNIYFALRSRLAGTGCEPLGPDAGVATIGNAVRYPDALVTRTKGLGTDHLIPDVVVVFEVLNPTSGRADRFDKVIEYRAVASIRRYIIVECRFVGLTVFHRGHGTEDWTAMVLTGSDTLRMPEIGIEVPVADIYAETEMPARHCKMTNPMSD